VDAEKGSTLGGLKKKRSAVPSAVKGGQGLLERRGTGTGPGEPQVVTEWYLNF